MGNLKDYATGIIATAPSPATSGTSIVLQTGHGARFPETPFYITAHPSDSMPTPDTAEKLLVTDVDDDTLTVTRAQGDLTAKSIAVGWIVSNAIFVADIAEGKHPVAVVAAYDAPQWIQNIALFQCTGENDHLKIQEAIDNYRYVYCSEGNFACADDIELIGDNTPETANMIFRGSGDEITNFNFASGKGFIIGGCNKIIMEDMLIRVSGNGDGIKSLKPASGSYRRAFWQSFFRNIKVVGDFSTHTGWAYNFENPFRSVFINVNSVGTKNGLWVKSTDSDFNPGNCTFINCFMETNLADGTGYRIQAADDGGNMNMLTFLNCDGIDSATSTTSIGWHFIGSSTTFWTSKDILVRESNMERYNTTVKIEHCENLDINLNYVGVQGTAGTVFDVSGDSISNQLRVGNLNIGGTQTIEILNDANASADHPTILHDCAGFNASGGTMTITPTAATVLRDLHKNGDGTYPAEYSASTPATPLRHKDIATGIITPRADDVDLSGGSDGDVLTVQADGSLALEAPSGGGGGGSMDDFTLAGDSGTPQTIADGNTLTIEGGTGIDTAAGVTDKVTVALDSATQASLALADSAAQNLGDLGVTASAAELNALDGITATVTELNYTDGVTSSIQTQLDSKLDDADSVSDVGGLIHVNHGGTAGTARPSVSGAVIWVGTVEPTNAANGDIWYDVS